MKSKRPVEYVAVSLLALAVLAAPALAGEREWAELTDRGYELYKNGHYEEAVSTARMALAEAERVFGPDDTKIVGSLDDLATYTQAAGNNAEAEEIYKRALGILENKLSPDDPFLAIFMDSVGTFYDKIGKPEEASKLRARAKAIRFKDKGSPGASQ